MIVIQIYRINVPFFRNLYLLLTVRLSKILVFNLINAENIFYIMFAILLHMFHALCAHDRKSKLYYTASDIVTLVESRSVHSPVSIIAPDGHIYF